MNLIHQGLIKPPIQSGVSDPFWYGLVPGMSPYDQKELANNSLQQIEIPLRTIIHIVIKYSIMETLYDFNRPLHLDTRAS